MKQTMDTLTIQGKFSTMGAKPMRPVLTVTTNFGLAIRTVGIYRTPEMLITRTLSPCCMVETSDVRDEGRAICPACIAPMPGHGITSMISGFHEEAFTKALEALAGEQLDPLRASLAVARFTDEVVDIFSQAGLRPWRDFPCRLLA